MGRLVEDDGSRIPDELQERIELLPRPGPAHPVGRYNLHVRPDALIAILFVLHGLLVERR